MNSEQMLMMQLYGGGMFSAGGGWLKVIFLASLIAIPILRPERIILLSQYRRACMAFGVSIVLPGVATILMSALITPNVVGGGMGNSLPAGILGIGLLQLLTGSGPLLFGLSIIFLLKAIVPKFIPPTAIESLQRPPGKEKPDGSALHPDAPAGDIQ